MTLDLVLCCHNVCFSAFVEQGEAALKARNVFHPMTYENSKEVQPLLETRNWMSLAGNMKNFSSSSVTTTSTVQRQWNSGSSSSSQTLVDLDGLRNTVLKFGQTPTQLFKKKHPPRKAAGMLYRKCAGTFLQSVEVSILLHRAGARQQAVDTLGHLIKPLASHVTNKITGSFFYHGSTRPYQLQPLPKFLLFIPPGAARSASSSAAAAFQSAAPSSTASATSTSAASASAKLVFGWVFLSLPCAKLAVFPTSIVSVLQIVFSYFPLFLTSPSLYFRGCAAVSFRCCLSHNFFVFFFFWGVRSGSSNGMDLCVSWTLRRIVCCVAGLSLLKSLLVLLPLGQGGSWWPLGAP